MQAVSALYRRILQEGGWQEVRLDVEDTAYHMDDNLVSLQTSHALFDAGLCVGSCVAGAITARLIADPADIPRRARLRLYLRAVDHDRRSEWLPKGVFYLDTRSYDQGSGLLTLTGYDAMLMAEQDFALEGDQGSWPKTDLDTAREIARRLDTQLEPRTAAVLNKGYGVGFPGYGDGAYTLREVLGYIGAMYAGNWTITDEGLLRLVPLGEEPAETDYLVSQFGEPITLGGDHIVFVDPGRGVNITDYLVAEHGDVLGIGDDRILARRDLSGA